MATITYGGASTEYSHTALGLFADSYRAGGWTVVVIWFILLGFLSAWLYCRGPGSESFAGIVFYTTVLRYMLDYEVLITTAAIRLIQFGPLLWIIIVFFMFRPAAKTRNGSPE